MLDLRVFAILAAMAAVLTIPADEAVVHLGRLLPHLPLWQQALDLLHLVALR